MPVFGMVEDQADGRPGQATPALEIDFFKAYSVSRTVKISVEIIGEFGERLIALLLR